VKLPVGGAAVNVQGHRNHVRLLAELAHNSCVPVLHEGADRFGGIHDLECVQRRGKRCHHLRFRHGQIHQAELQQRMPTSEQMFGVHVGDGASGRDIHVAAHQNGADR
jgi:hypothetical protein